MCSSSGAGWRIGSAAAGCSSAAWASSSSASLLSGLAWSEGSLIGFRALQGLGAALLSPAALALLMTTFAEGRERNTALGVFGAAAGSGGAAGVLLGGVLTSYLSWSWIFFINVPVGLFLIAMTPRVLRESHGDLHHRSFDLAGAASITSGLMLLVYAMTRATQIGWSSAETIALLAVSASLVAAFFVIELRSKAPLLPLRIFRLRTLAGSNLTSLLIGASIFSMFFLLTLYMQQVLHYSAVKTGVAYIPLTFASHHLRGGGPGADDQAGRAAGAVGRDAALSRGALPVHPASRFTLTTSGTSSPSSC